MLDASDEVGRQWVTNFCNGTEMKECIPEDWRRSLMVKTKCVLSDKGSALYDTALH